MSQLVLHVAEQREAALEAGLVGQLHVGILPGHFLSSTACKTAARTASGTRPFSTNLVTASRKSATASWSPATSSRKPDRSSSSGLPARAWRALGSMKRSLEQSR